MRLLVVVFLFLGPVFSGQDLLDSYSPDALEKYGDARYQRGQPDQALPYYAKSIEKQPERVSSILAAARILESGFRPGAAEELYRRVTLIEPRNRGAIEGLARVARTPQLRLAALRRVVSVSGGETATKARREIRLLEALGGRTEFEASQADRPYVFELGRAGPNCKECNPGAEDFLVLPLMTPGRARLRLLIGTATDGIWLTSGAARALGARTLFKTYYPWVDFLWQGRQAVIDSLQIGELTLRNCPVFVKDGATNLNYAADGVIGTNVFKDFLIEIDHAASELRLTPSTPENPLTASKDFVSIRHFGPFLLAPVQWDEEMTDYFVVNTIASDVNFRMGQRPRKAHVLRSGPTHALTGWTCSNWLAQDVFEVDLIVASARWRGLAAMCKMDDLNRAAGFPVKGVLGYQFLRGFNLVIDYQQGLMGFIPQAVAKRMPAPSVR